MNTKTTTFLLLTFAILSLSSTAFAEDNSWSLGFNVGANLSYGSHQSGSAPLQLYDKPLSNWMIGISLGGGGFFPFHTENGILQREIGGGHALLAIDISTNIARHFNIRMLLEGVANVSDSRNIDSTDSLHVKNLKVLGGQVSFLGDFFSYGGFVFGFGPGVGGGYAAAEGNLTSNTIDGGYFKVRGVAEIGLVVSFASSWGGSIRIGYGADYLIPVNQPKSNAILLNNLYARLGVHWYL